MESIIRYSIKFDVGYTKEESQLSLNNDLPLICRSRFKAHSLLIQQILSSTSWVQRLPRHQWKRREHVSHLIEPYLLGLRIFSWRHSCVQETIEFERTAISRNSYRSSQLPPSNNWATKRQYWSATAWEVWSKVVCLQRRINTRERRPESLAEGD